MMPKVGVILVNFNGLKYTTECITSLLRTNYSNLYIYVIENGSLNEDVKKLVSFSKLHRQVKLIQLTHNVGLTKANNIGLRTAINDQCEYLWILNNDTEVKSNSLELFLQAYRKNKLSKDNSVVTSIITFDDGETVWSNGMYDIPIINFPKSIDKNKKISQLKLSNNELKSCLQASSCSLFVHRDFCQKHGLMSEEFFIYYDDLDWSRRGHVKVIQQPLIRHKVSATSGDMGSDGFTPFKAYWNGRNAILFYFKRKLIPWYEKVVFLCFTVWVMIVLYIRDLKTLVSYWRGIKDGLWKTN